MFFFIDKKDLLKIKVKKIGNERRWCYLCIEEHTMNTSFFREKIIVEEQIKINFVNKNAEAIFNKKDHILIGISPLNSYYSEERIYQLLNTISSFGFQKMTIFAADGISIYNYLAYGYDEKKAYQKTKHLDNILRNKILRCLNRLEIDINNLFILEKFKATDDTYKMLHQYFENIILKDKIFQNIIFDMIRNIRLPITEYLPLNEQISLKYFLAEMPFLLNSSQLFNVDSSILVYHQIPFFVNYLFNEKKIASKNQGFMKLNFM